jgi:hypothetical protein
MSSPDLALIFITLPLPLHYLVGWAHFVKMDGTGQQEWKSNLLGVCEMP